jgi:lysophospholipase L1-like esterase
VFLGDTVCFDWTSNYGAKIFEKEFGSRTTSSFGIRDDRTQNVLWRLQHGELGGARKPRVVMLMVGGANVKDGDSAQDIDEGVKAILQELLHLTPRPKLLLIGIIAYGDDTQQKTAKAANKLLAEEDDGGLSVKFMDIGDKFVSEDGSPIQTIYNVRPRLHITAAGYQIFADEVKPAIHELLAK